MTSFSRVASCATAIAISACGSSVYSPGLPDAGGATDGDSGGIDPNNPMNMPDGGSAGDGSAAGDSGSPMTQAIEIVVPAIAGKVDSNLVMSLGWIAVDANNIYVTAIEGTNYFYLVKTPKTGSPSTVIYNGQAGRLGGVAVDGTNAYTGDGSLIVSVPIAGGASSMFATGVCANATAVDATNVYLTGCGAVRSKSKAAGPAILLDSIGSSVGLAVDDHLVYGGTTGSTPTIFTIPLAGGAHSTALTPHPGLSAFAIDATDIYWVERGTGFARILAAPKTGGAQRTILEVSGNDPNQPFYGLAIDDTYIWWPTYSNRIVRLKK